MRTKRNFAIAAIFVACCAVGTVSLLKAQQRAATEITVGANDLGGVVTGAKGPEAGVWVIAETTDLPTKFAKMVVTDDRGRYVIPDLPKAALQRMGARLRAGRFAESEKRTPGNIST